MSAPTHAATSVPADADRRSPGRWWGIFFSTVWLAFLVPVLVDAVQEGSLRSWAGAVDLVAFSVVYVWLARTMRFILWNGQAPGWRWALPRVGPMLALAVLAVALLGMPALSTAPFIAVVAVMALGPRQGVIAVLVIAGLVTLFAEVTHQTGHLDGIGYGVLGAGFAMFGITQMIMRNHQMVRAEQARAQLAVESERNRFGRDLHDILGHSLTVITVKAELAGRLAESNDPQARQRVRAELADLERLSRDALADVRRTVEGYREITLAGELARARAALEAAGIRAEVSSAADAAPSDLRELFAWTVREGVTNVVRHSGARTCTVTVDERSVRIEDDGAGSEEAGHGNGLRGLSERASAAGARLLTRSVAPHGFSLTVESSP